MLLGTSFVQTSLGAYEHPFLLGSVVYLKGGLLSSAFVGVTQQLFKEIALRFQTDFQRDVNSTSRDKCSACSTRLTALGTASLLHANYLVALGDIKFVSQFHGFYPNQLSPWILATAYTLFLSLVLCP